MVINKTCFRGMYREGPNGYNIPYGHYKKTPTVITRENLDTISDLIKDVTFICAGFNKSIKCVKKGDFVYLDPPYAPGKYKSFVGYVADGFKLSDHIQLFTHIKKMKGAKFVLSNAKVELVMEHFKDYKYDDILARRAIHRDNPGTKAKEVLIYN